MKKLWTLTAALAMLTGLGVQAQTHEMTLQVKKVGAPIQPTMYGLFFEDINFAADGGLYAEMVENRSFEYPQQLFGWKTVGNVQVRNDGPFDKNPHYVRMGYTGHKDKFTVMENSGIFGMGVKQNKTYRFTVWARLVEGNEPVKIRVELCDPYINAERQAFVTERVTIDSKDWKKYQVILKSPVTNPKATMRIFLEGKQAVDLEHVSLFPTDTWKGRENGMRKDLAQALADLKPGIFRFPGGCIVEGTDLDTRYNWKNTVGPVENRPLNENRWQYTFPYRYLPDYYQSYGLGFFEFFQLCEDFGAEALPVLSCGLACQFQNDDMSAHQPVDQLDSYVQDALDLIEFANGGTDTKWGKLRAEMGHAAPFNLKFIAIGNEQWDAIYPEHLEPFVKAIRKAYPNIKIVGSAGPNSEGEQFDYLWPEMKRLGADLVDEHFYRPADWFLSQGARYDNYDRKGPKVFAGEYACHIAGKKYNHFYPALLEAAFMTGLERNADIVHMATYAPLFAHVDGWQWRPDLIWFDNLNVVRTASYLVQQLYSTYKGTNVLNLTMNGKPVTGADGQDSLFASSVINQPTGEIYVKVANTSERSQHVSVKVDGLKKGEALKSAKAIVLQSNDLEAENSIANPNLIKPFEYPVQVNGNMVSGTIPANTFVVVVIQSRT
ncbi:MAG: carbohydrate binding domain-containing protein [Bacteroidaceae bacterium]|nr:carbohydrate binding domain-containing protein [Bacteroidaceae bacterium]